MNISPSDLDMGLRRGQFLRLDLLIAKIASSMYKYSACRSIMPVPDTALKTIRRTLLPSQSLSNPRSQQRRCSSFKVNALRVASDQHPPMNGPTASGNLPA